MPVPYRCKKIHRGKQCDTRVSLPKLATLYKVPPRCPTCKKQLTYIDKCMQRRHKRERCYCGEISFSPHRRGMFGCAHYNGPRDAEQEARDNGYDTDHLAGVAGSLGATTLGDDIDGVPF